MSLFLSFLGGAAEQFTDTLQESAKTAKAEAALKMKALTENYKEVLKNNGKLQNELKEDALFIRNMKSDATEDQISAIVFNRPVMEAVKKHFKDNPEAAKDFDLTTFTGLTNQNASPYTAAQRIEAYLKLPKAAKEVDQVAEGTGLFERVAGKQRKAAETQMAAALGYSVEELRRAEGFVSASPDMAAKDIGAKFDMSMLGNPKKMADIVDKAQMDLLEAKQSGNDTAIKSAQTRLELVDSVKDAMSSDTEKFNNKLARLKTDSIGNDPAKKAAADKELARIWALEKRQKESTKTAGEREGESKVPRLGTLNTVAGAAAADAITAKYGRQVKDGTIAITRGADGSVNIVPLVTDINLRKQIVQDAERAATQSLSLYIKDGVPINDEVATAINRFKVASQFAGEEVPVQPKAGAAKPTALPPPAAAPAQAPAASTNIATLRQQANDAITKGANPDAVKARFKQQTGQEL
jgi:hypothetical protein